MLFRIGAVCGRADVERMAEQMSCRELEGWCDYLDESPADGDKLAAYICQLTAVVAGLAGGKCKPQDWAIRFGQRAAEDRQAERDAAELEWVRQYGDGTTSQG
jgi:hypothetical protein